MFLVVKIDIYIEQLKKETNESINYRKQIKNMKADLEYYKEYSYNACDSYNQLLNKTYNVK